MPRTLYNNENFQNMRKTRVPDIYKQKKKKTIL